MTKPIILASGSSIRQQLFQNAGVDVEIKPAQIDELSIRDTLIEESASPRDIADTLAELKARKISGKAQGTIVIGCDQVLAHKGRVFGKPADIDEAKAHLKCLRGDTHQLLSAAVIYEDNAPVWRHVSSVRMTMHAISDAYLDAYLKRNWHSIQYSVGGYKLEEEGVRLFSQIQGDYFTVLGLPLLEILAYLSLRGMIEA